MLTLCQVKDAPEGIKRLAPTNANSVGYMNTNTSTDSGYLFARQISKMVTEGNEPLMEGEFQGNVVEVDDPEHTFYVFFF